jgi:hypothetical protein
MISGLCGGLYTFLYAYGAASVYELTASAVWSRRASEPQQKRFKCRSCGLETLPPLKGWDFPVLPV